MIACSQGGPAPSPAPPLGPPVLEDMSGMLPIGSWPLAAGPPAAAPLGEEKTIGSWPLAAGPPAAAPIGEEKLHLTTLGEDKLHLTTLREEKLHLTTPKRPQNKFKENSKNIQRFSKFKDFENVAFCQIHQSKTEIQRKFKDYNSKEIQRFCCRQKLKFQANQSKTEIPSKIPIFAGKN